MTLTEEVKNKIIEILDSQEFKSDLYEGLSEKKREELGQVYTPGKVCIQMLESFSCDSLISKTILDPACGSGNLLIACLIAGADSNKIYGNEIDPVAVKLCRKRVNRACDLLDKPKINDWQIHRGDATDSFCLKYFSADYKQKLEQHYLDKQYSLFPMLTKEQEEFLSEVD
jgi:SAM-dependent methyltransferase